MLSDKELERYDRQLLIEGFGKEGQEKLKNAKVFIAGIGGLGSAISLYLVAAGVGSLRIVDKDKVSLSNLNRQLLHWEGDVGRKKAESAREKLQRMNREIEIETIEEVITELNISQLVADCHLIVDALDNFPTRYLLNKTAIKREIPFFYGGVYGLMGMITTIIPGKTACLRCIFPEEAPLPQKIPVVGVTPGVIGCIQATEVIKYLVGIGGLLIGRLLVYDGLELRFTEIQTQRNPQCKDCFEVQVRSKG